jgi:hypothetical protein
VSLNGTSDVGGRYLQETTVVWTRNEGVGLRRSGRGPCVRVVDYGCRK